jgi:nickel transport system ATP-binding protein
MAAVPALRVENLEITAFGPQGPLPLVRRVSLTVPANRVVGLIGESGCGKSLTCLGILGLLPGNLRRTRGEVYLHGEPVHALPPDAMRRHRGRSVAVILQNPMSCFDAVHTIRQHFRETLASHGLRSNGSVAERAAPVLREVGLDNAREILDLYPFQMSGGMLQRVMIALALLLEPPFLIADEPTTDLDAVSQATVLDLLASLRARRGLGILLVTHDLSVIVRLADEVAVMREGVILESGPVEAVFAAPGHSYTASLLEAHHSLDRVYRERLGTWLGGTAGTEGI